MLLLDIPSPMVEFNSRVHLEVQEVVASARASSAPGASEGFYKVYNVFPVPQNPLEDSVSDLAQGHQYKPVETSRGHPRK